jgi:hypothetical protein
MWTFSADTKSVSTAPRFFTRQGTIGKVSIPGFSPNQVLTVSPKVLAQIKAQASGGLSTPVVGPGLQPRNNIYQFVDKNGVASPSGRYIILLQPATLASNATNYYRFYYYPPGPGQPEIQAASQLVSAILGDNIGDLRDIPGSVNWDGQPWSDNMVRQDFTENVIKPLMYGVTTAAQESDSNIPPPGNPRTSLAAQYNVDPLVWLVHTAANWPNHQRIYAYAFSVDDNYGNVQIGGSSGMEVTVGGANGLTDPKPYRS